jgi:AraC-like DNA-binding protein
MIYRTFAPSPRLAPHVDCIWYLRKRGPAQQVPDRILPDGCMELIFHLRTPFSQADATGRFIRQPPALLVGQLSRFTLLQPAPDVEVLAARFKPAGARAFFRADLHELTDRHVALDRIDRGWAELAAQIGEAPTLAARLHALESGLGRRIAPLQPADERAALALDLLYAGVTSPRIAAVARTLGISERQLERTFQRDVGLTPKHYARLLRFRRMLGALDRGAPGWADLAAQAGYSDQSHLVREFRAFTGLAPRACLADQTPFAVALLG